MAQQQVRLLTRAMAEHHRAYATQIRISDGLGGPRARQVARADSGGEAMKRHLTRLVLALVLAAICQAV